MPKKCVRWERKFKSSALGRPGAYQIDLVSGRPNFFMQKGDSFVLRVTLFAWSGRAPFVGPYRRYLSFKDTKTAAEDTALRHGGFFTEPKWRCTKRAESPKRVQTPIEGLRG